MSRLEPLRQQFDLTWSLCDHHLERLGPDDLLWEPAPRCWTVHLGADDRWWPDWADTEPDPLPVPTIAWLSWHLDWWWSVTIEHVQGHAPRRRHEVSWPGDAASTVAWLRGLRERWATVLDGLPEYALDAVLGVPVDFPWPDGTELTVAHTIGWVNAELMKNTAEIGQLRLLRAAGRP